jgi:hypothetical protein
MPDEPQPCRDFLQHVGDILSELGKMGAAAAGTDIAGGMNDLLARQVFGQGRADRLASFGLERAARRTLGRRLAGCLALLEIFQPQFQLLNLRIQGRRRTAELHAPQLAQLRLVLLDQEMKGLCTS